MITHNKIPLHLLYFDEYTSLKNQGLLWALYPDAKGYYDHDCESDHTCCCGDYEENHGMGTGHSFVSMKQYIRSNLK